MEIYVKLLQSGRQIPNINDGKHEHIKHFLKLLGGRLSDNPHFRYFLTDGAEGSTPEYTSIELPYVGDFVFREGWDENAVTALFDAGKFGRSHQHEDKLNLLVYANGRPLLTEAQTYAYDSSDMRKYCLSSFGHNTAVVDALSQNRRLNFQWKDEYLSQREPIFSKITERLELAVGTYDEGYGEDAKPIAKHTRTVAFLKKPKLGRPLFAVVDTLESRDGAPHAYDIFWHAEQASLALSGSTAEGEDLRILTDGDGVSLSVVAGQTEPYVQGFVMRSTIQGDYYALPTLTAHAEGMCVRVLTVISVKENGISPVRAARLSGECVTLEYEGGESDEISLSVN